MIEHDPEARVWLLGTPRTSYVLQLVDDSWLRCHYWGPKLSMSDALTLVGSEPERARSPMALALGGTEEYPVDGGIRQGVPALSVVFPDRVRGVEWRFDRAETRHEDALSELDLVFADHTYPLQVTLRYRTYPDRDVIERWVELAHTGDGDAIEVRAVFSASWTIPDRADYRLSRLHGRWGAETQVDRVPLSPASSVLLSSRTGTTSHQANPWFAIDDGSAGEEHGEVWSGALAWSGSWQIRAERTPMGRVKVSGGIGHEDYSVAELDPGQSLRTPVFAGLYTDAGFGAASREWHSYLLRHILPQASEVRPVLYNSWEATGFEIDESGQRRLAEIAAELGVELFVMDDGWFGGRVNDRAGLGDWWPNPDRFPDGLGGLIEHVHGLGMGFGIWVEPEMVNPDSDLYRAHPDWVYHHPTRERSRMRNQLVLNFARPDVREWAYEWLHRLLSENAIDYVKWDMNRPITQAGWPDRPDHPERLWVDHVTNLYDVLDRLRREHPSVAFETCSGGGGRVDFGILARTDMAWTSDNTDGLDRLTIQHGFSQVYAPRVMSAWVTDSPDFLNRRESPLRWRFHVAMGGLLGLGGDLTKWSEEQRTEAEELVATYKRIRPVIQHGLLYRLEPPWTDGRCAVQYVAPDGSETVVLVYLHSGHFGQVRAPLRLRGLNASDRYRDAETSLVRSGALLAGHGLDVTLRGDFDSALFHLIRED